MDIDYEWIIIEFSELGFIGKLFNCKDLFMFINFFLTFSTNKPCDWLYDNVLEVKLCAPYMKPSECVEQKKHKRIKYSPSLFQHVGTESSLQGKIQTLKDSAFDIDGRKQANANAKAKKNPPARVYSSLRANGDHKLESVYSGEDYFWSHAAPSKGDFIAIEFVEPTKIFYYYVRSGRFDNQEDRLYDASLQIKFERKLDSTPPSNYVLDANGFYTIDKFTNDLSDVAGEIDADRFGKLVEMRIVINRESPKWIIIDEIALKSSKEEDF